MAVRASSALSASPPAQTGTSFGERVLPGAAGGNGPQREPSLRVWHLARPAPGYSLSRRGCGPY
eukprot:2292268-Alexandrium_andersonii.AAC.1